MEQRLKPTWFEGDLRPLGGTGLYLQLNFT